MAIRQNAVLNTGDLIRSVSVSASTFLDLGLKFVFAQITEGATTKSLPVTLRRNALVRKLDVVVTAAAASQVAAGVAGQIRTTSRGGGVTSIVVDFGTPRTIAAVSLPSGVTARSFSTWIGTKFSDAINFDPPANFARPPSEVRTERVELVVTGAVNESKLATDMFFFMPDLPSGLELRIDGGPPVFTFAAAVQPGAATALNDTDWNKDSSRIVHLAEAFAKLTGDAAHQEEATFTLTLTSRAPGFLDLREDTRDLRFIRRAAFDGAPSKDLEFETEGEARVRLENLQAGLNVEEVRWNAAATVPPTRVLPAVGPAPGNVADIRVTTDRAIIVRLDPATPLGQVTGLRLPLRAGASGAEARVVLWTNKPGANQPLAIVETGTSEPATIGKSDQERWTTFTFAQPVIVPADGLWAALNVNRGEVFFIFADNAVDTSWATVLWGAPAGPWRDLPFTLLNQRGRTRIAGTAKAGVKIDPYRLGVAAAPAQGFTPNPKGVAGTLKLSQPALQAGRTELVVTSFVAARLQLRDVEVVSTN